MAAKKSGKLIDKLLPSPELPPGLLEIDPAWYWKRFLGPSDFQKREREALFKLLKAEIKHARDQLPKLELINQAWQVYKDAGQKGYQHPVIFVVGALGSGKTSLAQRLMEVKSKTTMFEEITPEEWEFVGPILGKFYDLLKSHFQKKLTGKKLEKMHNLQDSLQNWFANNRMTKSLKAIIKSQDGPVSFDSSPISDAVYECVQRRLGVVRDKDFKRYLKTMQMRLSLIPPTGNVVYVHNGLHHLKTLRGRNLERGRDIEEGMPEGYLALLLDTCSQMTRTLMRLGAPVLLADSEAINFGRRDEKSEQAAKTIWQKAEDLTLAS